MTQDQPANRANTKYVGIPADLYDALKKMADEQERSVAWMAKRAVQFFLDHQADGAGQAAKRSKK